MNLSSSLRFLLPEYWQADLKLPLIKYFPLSEGRKLPNGTLIVDSPQSADDVYKFVPWIQAELALNEIAIYARLYAADMDMAHIVPLKAIGATRQYFVRKMQRSSFGELDRFLYDNYKGQCQLSEQKISTWLMPLVETLAQLHALNILHRDLKAENILVFAQDDSLTNIQLKLCDFDRAIYLAQDDYLEKPVGSLLHMAPELLAWQSYNHKVDIYAFAMLLFELAHGGRQPYANIGTGMPDSITRAEFAQQVVNNNFRPKWQHASLGLKMLAEACWQANPNKRPSFNEIFIKLKALSKPLKITEKRVKPVSIDTPQRVGLACHIGKVRSQMEDAATFIQRENYQIAAVFDGLRSYRSSSFTAFQLPLLVADALKQNSASIEATLQECFAQVENTLKTLQPPIECGSTATLALLDKDECWLAWLGDSPAWLVRSHLQSGELDEVIELTLAHHPDNADEAARIVGCGGRVGRELIWMDNGEKMPSGPSRAYYPADNKTSGIALSRVLGLFDFKPAVSSEIQIVHYAYQTADNFLLLASDGVFNYLDKPGLLNVLKLSNSAQQAADGIIEAVLKRGAPDNAAVIVIDLKSTI